MENEGMGRKNYLVLEFSKDSPLEMQELRIVDSGQDPKNGFILRETTLKFLGHRVFKTREKRIPALRHYSRIIRERYLNNMYKIYGMKKVEGMGPEEMISSDKHTLKSEISLYKTKKDIYVLYEDTEFVDEESGEVVVHKLVHCETRDKNELARVGIEYLNSGEYLDLLKYLNDRVISFL